MSRAVMWGGSLAGVALAAMVVAWYASPAGKQPGTTPSPVVVGPQGQMEALAPVSEAVLADQPKPSRAAAKDIRAAFNSATDYKVLAAAILPTARAGDADAEFYLARVLEYCTDGNRMYFQHRGQKLSIDEGLQFAVKRHLPMEVAQSVFDRCHGFEGADQDFGSAADWLSKATDAGQPLAEASTATKLLMQLKMDDFARAGGVPDPGTRVTAGKRTDPSELLSAAVKSKDPEVLFTIGEAQPMLSPSASDTNTARYAWWLVACQRGLDCSSSADWVRTACAGAPECASASGPSDLVRTLSGNEWPEVQQRAQEINSKLDANQWDQLRLVSN